jgi:hypothetical protein
MYDVLAVLGLSILMYLVPYASSGDFLAKVSRSARFILKNFDGKECSQRVGSGPIGPTTTIVRAYFGSVFRVHLNICEETVETPLLR